MPRQLTNTHCACGKRAQFKAMVAVYAVGVFPRKTRAATPVAFCKECIMGDCDSFLLLINNERMFASRRLAARKVIDYMPFTRPAGPVK